MTAIIENQNKRVIATKHGAFRGLLRPFLLWVATSLFLFVFGEQIRNLFYVAVEWLIDFALNYQLASSLYETVGGSETISQGMYWLASATWVGGYFYLVLFSYVIDAIFYLPKMPRELVLRTDSELTLAKPVEVLHKSTRKKILAVAAKQAAQTNTRLSWLSPKKVDPDEDIWEEEDWIDEVSLRFDQIQHIWLNPESKHYEKELAEGKSVYGALIVLTVDERIYAQSAIEDLQELEKSLSPQL